MLDSESWFLTSRWGLTAFKGNGHQGLWAGHEVTVWCVEITNWEADKRLLHLLSSWPSRQLAWATLSDDWFKQTFIQRSELFWESKFWRAVYRWKYTHHYPNPNQSLNSQVIFFFIYWSVWELEASTWPWGKGNLRMPSLKLFLLAVTFAGLMGHFTSSKQ